MTSEENPWALGVSHNLAGWIDEVEASGVVVVVVVVVVLSTRS